MYNLHSTVVVLITFFNLGINGERVIASPNVTYWGAWGIWDECPQDHYVIGFRLKVQEKQGPRVDDTALNGITLFCGKRGSRKVLSEIKSSEGQFGEFGQDFYCNDGLLEGFQLRTEPDQGTGDDTSANNLKGFCTSKSGEIEIYEGDGLYWGSWTDDQHCHSGEAICGIQTQNDAPLPEETKEKHDGTSINNVRMKCCHITDISRTSGAENGKISFPQTCYGLWVYLAFIAISFQRISYHDYHLITINCCFA